MSLDKLGSLLGPDHLPRVLAQAETLPALVLETGDGARVTGAGPGAAQWFGVAPTALIGRGLRALLGEARFCALEAYYEAARAGQAVTYECEIDAGGGLRAVQVSLMPGTAAGAGGAGVTLVVADVSWLKADQALLREREIMFRAMNEDSPFGVFVDTPELGCIYINAAYERMCGLPREQALGQGWKASVHPQDRDLVDSSLGVRRARVEREVAEHRYLHADGRIVLARVTVAPMRDGERVLGFIGVVEDITEARRNEQALARLNAELEGRVNQRTAALAASIGDMEAFTYTVSHDLRAPLRALDGYGALLLEKDALDGEARQFLRSIRATTQRMSQLIDDLLALAHTGRKVVTRRRLDLAQVARSLAVELAVAWPGSHVALNSPDSAPAQGDPELVRTLLQNLLDNAWKFSSKREQAQVEFGSVLQDGAEVFFVRDNGAGFDAEHAGKMFLPFQRLHAVTEFAGNGIGLASARRIVEAHGGRIWAKSAPGAGATFYFTLGMP